MTSDRDPFYVGYHPSAPTDIARAFRLRVIVIAVAVLAAAALLAAAQRREEPGVFEFGHVRHLHGRVEEFPYPSLLVPGTGMTGRDAAYTRYLLVATGKHGAQLLAAGLDGRWVDLRGTRIARPGREMLEVVAGSVIPQPEDTLAASVRLPALEQLGRRTLEGEVVDSKCWLGVMRPATGNVHRGCAARCLSGGIPPLLMTTDSTGATAHYLLTDAEGRPAQAWFADLVGRRVRLSGAVVRDGDLLVMRVEQTSVAW